VIVRDGDARGADGDGAQGEGRRGGGRGRGGEGRGHVGRVGAGTAGVDRRRGVVERQLAGEVVALRGHGAGGNEDPGQVGLAELVARRVVGDGVGVAVEGAAREGLEVAPSRRRRGERGHGVARAAADREVPPAVDLGRAVPGRVEGDVGRAVLGVGEEGHLGLRGRGGPIVPERAV